jgi:hypothetical protein
VTEAHRSSRVCPRSGRSPVTSSHSTTPNEKIYRDERINFKLELR